MTEPSPAINPEKEKRLNAMIAEYLKRKDAGQQVNKDAMLKAYPDLADGLRSYFLGEAMIGENSPALALTKLSPVPLASDVRETLKPGAAQADTASEFGNRKFGRYQILRPLGEGAMGSVYLALDTTLDRQVALKVPKTEGTANAEFMARFTREAKAAAGLKHANICSVYDAGEHEGTAYITMDFIDGVPLSRFIGTEKLQSVDGILQMISIIADAVGHAHSKGVIHRDLKPGNILVDADFKPHVTDFGLARRAGGPADESRLTQEGLLIGTPAYMAPEQVKGEQSKVGPQSDIYSLGVILFELLTCRLPFEGKVPEMLAKVLRDAPPVPSRIRKDLTEDVDDLFLKMLQKNPERRFASIPEVMSKIETLRTKLRETSAPSSQATAQQKSPFEIQKAHIELMLKKGQYAAAIQDLEKLAQETLPGAKAAAAWAKTKLPTVKKEAKSLSPSGLEALLKTAQQMFQKSDYVGCAQLIEEIPPLRRTEPMEDLLDKSKRREAEADQLLLDIKDKERREDIDGLEPLVRKLLKLKPGSAYAKRLTEALQSYSKTPPTRRKYRYEKGRLQPMPEPGFLRQWAVLGSLVGILVFLSVYSYVIFYLKSGNQTLAVHIDDEWLKSQGGEVTLVVDGDNHTISTPSTGGASVTVTVSLGQHTFSVKHGDTIVHDPRQFTIEKDGRKVLSITATDVRLENGVPAPRSALESIAQESAALKSVASNNDRPAVVPEPEKQTSDNVDWIPLFDGSDVSRWSTLGPFSVKDGLLVAAANTRGNAISRDQYGDFELEAEWKITKGTNSGIYYRDIATERVLSGNEYQIADGTTESDVSYNQTGSIYGIIKPSVRTEQTIGEWNQTRIFCRGPHIEHWLNGRKLLDYDTASPEWKKLIEASTANGKENIGTRQTGHILLQGFKGEITFRSIRIRELSPASKSKIPGGADIFEGHSYKFYNESLSWSEAKKKCESMGGHLPIVESAAQNEFLIKMADKNFPRENRNGWESIWLGMTDKETEGDWRWVDGKPLGYTNWFRLQPNNTENEEHFGLLWLSNSPGEITGQWCDQPDHTQKHVMAFICEWDTERAQVSNPSSAADPLLLAVAPFDAAQARKHQEVWATHLGQPVEYANSIGMKLRLIPPGEFMMGSPAGEAGRAEGEGSQHPVRLTQPFYMGMTEVTQSQWFAVMGTRPWQVRQSTPEGNDYPATFVSWNDAVAFCEKMSSADGVTYRLPTEAEWEFACRAGTSTEYSFGSDVGQLGEFAWTVENADHTAEKYAHSVGTKKANSFGLSDMHGNVYEFCQDHMGRYIGGASTAIDPINSADGEYRVTRGGAWDCGPFEARSATRGSAMPDFYSRRDGFRVVRVMNAADSESMSVEQSSISDLDRIAIGKWVPLVDSNTVLSDPDKMHFRDGVLELDAISLLIPDLNIRNVIVRADVKKSYPNMGLTVRWSIGKDWTQAYAAWFNGTQSNDRDRFGIAKAMKSSVALAVGSSGHTFESDQFVDLAISAIDNEVSVYVEGKKILSAIDGDYESGSIALGTMNGKGLFRNVRYQTLDQEKREPLETPAVSAVNPQPLVAPFDAEHAVKAQEAWSEYLKVPVEYTSAIGMTFRLIPPGEFLMGSTPEQIEAAKPHLYTVVDSKRPERANSEGPQRMVRLTRPFFLATTEVTQKNFALVVGRNPSKFAGASDGNGGEDRAEAPVENATWLDAGEFCNRLSKHEQLDSAYVITPISITQTGTGGYRLPTEAEWEFSCRAGTTSLFWSGDDEASLVKNSWCGPNNSANGPKTVATLAANPFGLFDMHGNVWEWVHDGWQAKQYERLPQPIAVDPRSDVADENRRVIRGGDFFMSSSECRSACRDGYHADSHWDDVGFRVALSVEAVRQLLLAEKSTSVK